LCAAALAGVRQTHGACFMTRCDWYVTINTVKITDLKSRLSEPIRKVRAGRTLTIVDRNHPIARRVPIEKDTGVLNRSMPLASAPKLQHVPLPPPLRLRKDIFVFLNEEWKGER
jgi:antitoxin (DNA-binding transcriptional repressor) of toxin-antitoxin stability system